MSIVFEWDEAKVLRNLRKHGVAFDDAVGVFSDPFAIMRQDRIEGGELRWQTLGMIEGHLLLLVAHTVGETQGAQKPWQGVSDANQRHFARGYVASHARP